MLPNHAGAKIFTATSEELQSILPAIEAQKAVLPNFQRPWVWEPRMVQDLIVSVANRYPAGSLLTMPITSSDFALRPFSGAGETVKGTPSLMVLDGQQRLTSLFQSLYSSHGVHAPDGKTYYFYLDIDRLIENSTENSDRNDQSAIENCIYFVEDRKGIRQRYEGFSVVADLTTRQGEIAHAAFPLRLVFSPDEAYSWIEQFRESRSGDSIQDYKEQGKTWDTMVNPWLSGIRTYPFPIVDLRSDMPLPAICHIFEKVNSTGVSLSVFDLCTAILWAQEFKLNDKWDETKGRLQNDQILRMQGDLEGTGFLQVISLLYTLDRKLKDPDGRIAVNCRRDDLLKLRAPTVREWWSMAEDGYREASKFMEAQGIVSKRILPYTTMLTPLAAVFGTLASRKMTLTGHLWPKIARWYWCSVFTQRYSSSVEASAAVDLEQVINWIDGGDEPTVVRTFFFAADRLQELRTIRNVVYKGILCLLARDGAKDFGGKGTLSINLYYDSHHDHHHIFPVAALTKLGITDLRSESIINKTLIGAADNRSIGGRLPSQYLDTMKSRQGDDLVTSIMRSHLIVPEALAEDDWDQFVLARREELRDLIQRTCGGSMQPFTDGQEVDLPARLMRLLDDVKATELQLRNIIEGVTGGDWKLVSDHIRVKADERLESHLRANPGVDRLRYSQMSGRLEFCDLRELEQILTTKGLWESVADTFGSKSVLTNRFNQLAPLRNANAHARTIDDQARIDGEAAVLWFKSAISRHEQLQSIGEASLPADDDSEIEG